MRADLDNMVSSVRNSEEKFRKATSDAGRLSDELRTEQDHSAGLERAARCGEMSLGDLTARAEEAAAAAALAAQQLPARLDARVREVEHELGRTVRMASDYHKGAATGERKVRELHFQAEEDAKNQERIAELADKLQQKIRSYKRQIEEAEEIAAINLAKYRKAQQELEEADERSRAAEENIGRFRGVRGGSVGY